MIRVLLLLAVLGNPHLSAAADGPVYVVLWFDTEDYIDPASDDAALRIATDLTNAGVRATFKLVGEKARVLQARGRTDVIRALSNHAIGYHSNWHSIQPVPAVYLRRLGWLEGSAEFERREGAGVLDLRRIFGTYPVAYGQPGSSWGPQANPALRRMHIPVYLDEGTQVGFNGQPFWYDGMLYVFNMEPNLFRANLDGPLPDYHKFDAIVRKLAENGGGLISSYYHPTEFVNTEFWDAANFAAGAVPERSKWRQPKHRSPADAERCFRILQEYVEHVKGLPGVRFVTAQEILKLYEPPTPPAADLREIAGHLSRHITSFETSRGSYSAADMLLQLLRMPPRIVDGPTRQGVTTLRTEALDPALFERAKQDAVSFIDTHERLPDEIFIGAETLSLEDFAATLAAAELSPQEIRLIPGRREFDRHFATDPVGAFAWPIHPKGFAAPELLDLARLQGWTLKPARLR